MIPDADPRALISRYLRGPAELERSIADLGDAELDTPPRQGGWTIRQIVHQVVDGDDICRWAYAQRPLDESLALFRSIRVRTPQGTERISVREMIAMQSDHVTHHVERIAAIRAERGGA